MRVKFLKGSLATLKVSGDDQGGEEHSPPYDSQANWAVEAAVKQVKAGIKTIQLCLEWRIAKRVPPRHPIMTWLAPHAAAIVTYRVRGPDGKTPYERICLRPLNGRLICVGERSRHADRSKEKVEDNIGFIEDLSLEYARRRASTPLTTSRITLSKSPEPLCALRRVEVEHYEHRVGIGDPL